MVEVTGSNPVLPTKKPLAWLIQMVSISPPNNVFGYDDSNEYFWSFGDEGTSTDPFPTWTYETNGPYQLCLTVSNEENDCSETYCETIEVDSLGWIFRIQDGFTITIMNGDWDSSNDVRDLSHHSIINMSPNPVNENNLTVKTNKIGDFDLNSDGVISVQDILLFLS